MGFAKYAEDNRENLWERQKTYSRGYCEAITNQYYRPYSERYLTDRSYTQPTTRTATTVYVR